MHKSDQQITQPRTTQALNQIFPAKFFLFLYANIVTTPHIGATEAFYWRLRGALENRNCEFYTEKEKEKGLNKLNEILSANGFRRCKRTLKKVE